MSWELHIDTDRPQINFQNRRFLKGHVPFNKGKKWDEWMPPDKRSRVLEIGRKNLRTNLPQKVWNARPIFAIRDDGSTMGWFESAKDAERKTGICARNITSVLHGQRKHAGGFKWIYDNK